MVEKHINLIRKITWNFIKKTTGLEFDDLFSEACLACMEASIYYDPTKGAETSFIWITLNNYLNTYITKEIRNKTKFHYVENIYAIDDEQTPEQEIIAKEKWDSFRDGLTQDGKEICDMILSDITMYLPTEKPKQCKTIIKNKLEEEKNWNTYRIYKGFKEIKEALI